MNAQDAQKGVNIAYKNKFGGLNSLTIFAVWKQQSNLNLP